MRGKPSVESRRFTTPYALNSCIVTYGVDGEHFGKNKKKGQAREQDGKRLRAKGKMKVSGRNRLFFSAIVIPLFLGAIYAYYEVEEENFHPIKVGEAYRSAQMDGGGLKFFIDKYHIKSILNLRGAKADEKWYIDEMKVSSKYNVIHYDVSLSAYSEPTLKETEVLMGIFKSAPRPILIHCQAGADRTGLAAAIWKVIIVKEAKMEAGKQLSIFYGHMSLGPASAMDHFFEKWLPKLAEGRVQPGRLVGSQGENHRGALVKDDEPETKAGPA
ncbi:MAG: tyrosine-protein phosphatase [Thermodesulfovibrionales bacterium]